MIIQRKAGATKKNRRSSSNSSFTPPRLPHWGSFAFGALIGIAITSVVYFKFATSEVTLKIPTSQSAKISEAYTEEIIQAEVETTEPHYDFYTELTKNSQPSNKARVLDLKTPPKTINGYLVQAGSFKKRTDADALKANLALNGISSRIESAKLNDAEVWYRVLTGPFKNEKAAQTQRHALKSIEIEGIIVHRYAE